MGVFDDKKFEQLDWMTQVTETIDSELNGLLAQLPDEKTFDFGTLLPLLNHSYNLSLSSGNVVRNMLTTIKHNLSYEEVNRISECFDFETSDTIKIDFEKKVLIGEIKLVKTQRTLEDEDLQKMMGAKGIENLRYGSYDDSMCGRANEVLDILDAPKEAIRCRSARKKTRYMIERLKTIFKTNEWRIRDMDLADKVSLWCGQYVKTGNLAALTNLCKLKVMIHNEMPIYSIKEEE